jgi:hypothetical protein
MLLVLVEKSNHTFLMMRNSGQQISQRVLIERGEEGVLRLGKKLLQSAAR